MPSPDYSSDLNSSAYRDFSFTSCLGLIDSLLVIAKKVSQTQGSLWYLEGLI